MRLLITTPTAVVVDLPDVASLRAEDDSGGFGILPGHADLLTTLAVSVVTWRHADGRTGCCAVRSGVLSVRGGREVAIATREAQLGEDVATLEAVVLAKLRQEMDTERKERVSEVRLHAQAIRQIIGALRAGRPPPADFRP
jgi:F-type H+-transporting ATPase subunit epsilon